MSDGVELVSRATALGSARASSPPSLPHAMSPCAFYAYDALTDELKLAIDLERRSNSLEDEQKHHEWALSDARGDASASDASTPWRSTSASPVTTTASRDDYVMEIIAEASCDFVRERFWESKETYLKTVDRFNDARAYAYATASNATFILCGDGKNEDVVRGFFQDVHEAYVVQAMNPMKDVRDFASDGGAFERAVRSAAKKRFGSSTT